jgi:TP901 family phage tail tape measure protein
MAENRELNLILTLQDRVSRELSGVQGKIKSMQPTFKKMAAVGGVAFTAIAGGAFMAANDVGKAAGKLKDMSDATGISTSSLQELEFAFEQAGIGSDMMQRLMERNLQRMGRAIDGNKTFTEAYERLGVEIQDTNGEMRNAEDVFDDVLVGLANIEDQSTRAAVAGELLGTNSGRKLAGALNNGIESIDSMRQKAHDLGIVMNDETIKAADDYAKANEELQKQIGAVKDRIGVALIPVLKNVLEAIKPVIDSVIEWVKENPELTRIIIIATGAISGLVAVVGLLGLVLPAVITGFTILAGPVGIVIGVIGLLTAATVILVKKWDKIKAFFRDTWEGIRMIFRNAIDWIMNKLQPLIDAVNTVKRVGSKIGSAVGGAVRSIIPGLAEGGIVRKPTLAMIGESGPEAVVPLNRAGATGGITVNINGGYYLDRNAGAQLAESIGEELRRRLRL